ncbi:MAG: hypothetical protein IPO32_15170 [Crocinitomicaceae bacterium]|nr:hypothetical protein [Crocinitomicaceae bacterium]
MTPTQVEIFKTNVSSEIAALNLITKLVSQHENVRFNFDLDDCDRILRAEGAELRLKDIQEQLTLAGFNCELILD